MKPSMLFLVALVSVLPVVAEAGPPVIQAGSIMRVRADNRSGTVKQLEIAPTFGLVQTDSITDEESGTTATATSAATYSVTFADGTATFHIAGSQAFSLGSGSTLAEGFIRFTLDEAYVYELTGSFAGAGSDPDDGYQQRTFLRFFQSPFSTFYLEDETGVGGAVSLGVNQQNDAGTGGLFNQSGTRTGTLGPGTYEFAYELEARDNDTDGAGSATAGGSVRLVLRLPGLPPCTYAISRTSDLFFAEGGTGTVNVTAPTGCAWTAVSNASFLTVTSGASGTGNGVVGYAMAAHALSTSRTGAITIADQILTVSQSGTTIEYPLAEGATGPFFDLDILLANPNVVPVPVTVIFLTPSAGPAAAAATIGERATVTQSYTLAPQSRLTIRVDDIPGLEDTAVSTVVQSTSGLPIMAERSMFWDQDYYGGHTEVAPGITATKWYFAEGSQGFFDTYLLVGNGTGSPASVTVSFLLESGSPVVKAYSVPANSRFNVFAGAIPELVDKSFSIVVDSNVPIIAERAMYFGTQRFWDGGHESAGVTGLATNWFHAEGATGTFFDTYVLVGNPNAQPATVTFTWLRDDGTVVTKTKVIPANARLTVNIELEDPLLANAAVSTTVTSDMPVISERAMYWPGTFATWFEAHNSFGVTATQTKWGLAEGRVGTARSFETYILLANGNSSGAAVTVRFLRTSGAPIIKTFVVPPTSRFNVHVNSMVPELANEEFGAVIEVTNGLPIAVERALYWNALGAVWAGGTNATAVKLP